MKRLTRFFAAALIISGFTLAPVADSEAWFNMDGPWNNGSGWGGSPWNSGYGGGPWNRGYGGGPNWGGGGMPWNSGWGGGNRYYGGQPYYGGGAPYYGGYPNYGGDAPVAEPAPGQYPEVTPVD